MSIFKFRELSLGIDIGGSSIKMVELSRFRKKSTLKNYAFLESATYGGDDFRAFEQDTLFLSSERTAEAVRACLGQAGIKPQKVVFSLPDFSSFFVSFELPAMSDNELSKAVDFQASKYIPIAMNEIVLDWKKVGSPQSKESRAPVNILAVAIPKKTMAQYRQVAEAIGATNFVLEPEAFSLFRVFAPRNDQPFGIIDFGAKSTTVSFGDRHGIHSSHSLDVAIEKIKKKLQEKLEIEEKEAQQLMRQEGFSSRRPEAVEVLNSMIAPLTGAFKESWQTLQRRGAAADIKPRVFLTGGAAAMPGLQGHLASALNVPIEIGRPFEAVAYPAAIKPVTEEIGPAFSVAVGAALRRF